MLHILLCEDDPNQRAHMEGLISKYIEAEGVDIALVLSTADPDAILEYLEAHPDKRGLYFLDVDLGHAIDGITLGMKIRETDPLAKIVFITTHAEMAVLTFRYKIHAMDFIVKDQAEETADMRTLECIQAAYQRYLEEAHSEPKYFKVDANGEIWNVLHDDILFFETNSEVEKRVILHTEKGELDFRGTLREVAALVPAFYRCHKSFLVNTDKITRVDKIMKEVKMTNGAVVLVAAKKMTELVGMMGER